MTVRINRDEVVPEDRPEARVWRQFRRDGPHHVGVGVAEFRPEAEGTVGELEAHDVPEVHYVLRGRGVLVEGEEVVQLRAGDAVITPAGRPHRLAATGSEPMVTIYVAIGLPAFRDSGRG